MLDLEQTLNLILEDQPIRQNPLDDAMALAHELDTAKQKVLDLQHQLSTHKHRLSGDLAISLRRTNPALSIGLDRNGCKVGYRTKHLLFVPDIEQGIWKVTSSNPRFLREFLNAHRRSTLLASDLTSLINAIVDYFTTHYRTIVGEDIVGTGFLMVDDRHASLSELVAWPEKHTKPNVPLLRSRLVRQVG